MPWLVSRSFPVGAKCRLYSACGHSVMLNGSETWPVKEEDVIRYERNDGRMVRWMWKVRSEDMISTEELWTKIELVN